MVGPLIGSWEKDTLVIDTVGKRQVLDGQPRHAHAEQMHTIERWTRTSYGTLRMTSRWTTRVCFPPGTAEILSQSPAAGLGAMEFICTENNQYGLGMGIEIVQEKGFGLEVKPGEIK